MIIQINIDERVIEFVKRNLKGKRLVLTLTTFMLLTCAIGFSISTLSLPYTFKSGDVISADQINSNFKALQDKVNELTVAIGGVPPGTIVAFGGKIDQIPAGWLLCDGRSLVRSSYPDLFNAIQDNWGSASSTEFNIPDLRGIFLRGSDKGANKDPDALLRTAPRTGLQFNGNSGDEVGSFQMDAFQEHKHLVIGASNDSWGYSSALSMVANMAGRETYSITSGRYSSETRSKNAAVHYIIKY